MQQRSSRPCRAVASAVLVCCAGAAMAQARPLDLTGSVKSLLVHSRAATGERSTLNQNRLRLQATGDVAPGLAIDLQYDNELLLGNYLRTAEFQALKDQVPPRQRRADANYVERDGVYGRHRLYRAAVTLSRGTIDLKLGRQRIAWGTGRFWSPLDVLNPVSPLALEREERAGVDAALLEAQLGPLSRASLVYAAAPGRGPPSRALRWHGNRAGIDASVVAGRLLGQDIVGVDAASQLGDTGIRAEAARLTSPGRSGFNRWMVGADHAFAGGLTLSAELYHDGAGARDTAGYDFPALRAGRVSTLGKRYAAMYASYEITPLLKWVTQLVRNLDDRSHAVDSRLVWSIGPATELIAGVQRANGAGGSEFSVLPTVVQAQVQWYFAR